MNKKILIGIIIIISLFLLSLTSARITDILEEQQIKTYETYNLTAIYIGVGKVKFRLNNMTSDTLEEHDYYRFEDGTFIYIREILENEAQDGSDIVSYRLYLPKQFLIKEAKTMKNITEKGLPIYSTEIKVIEEDIPVQEELLMNKTKNSLEKTSFWQQLLNAIKNIFKKR